MSDETEAGLPLPSSAPKPGEETPDVSPRSEEREALRPRCKSHGVQDVRCLVSSHQRTGEESVKAEADIQKPLGNRSRPPHPSARQRTLSVIHPGFPDAG